MIKMSSKIIRNITITAAFLIACSASAFADPTEMEGYKRVAGFADGQEYIIAVNTEQGLYALTYSEKSGIYAAIVGEAFVPENESWEADSLFRGISLLKDDHELNVDEESGELTAPVAEKNQGGRPPKPPEDEKGGDKRPGPPPAEGFEYAYGGGTGTLSFKKEDNALYVCFDEDETKFYTSDSAENAANIILYTIGKGTGGLITKQPESCDLYVKGDENYKTPEYSVETKLSGLEDVTCTWYLDKTPVQTAGEVFKLDGFADLRPGVHDIYALVSFKDGYGTWFDDESFHVNFISCTGYIPISFLTFSDVHYEFNSVGIAVSEIMNENEGRVPALIICTGDWAQAGSYVGEETTTDILIPALKAQMGGIDAYFVAGNHENGAAAKKANSGFTISPLDNGLHIFGIDYDDIVITDGEGNKTFSYINVIPRLQQFLYELAKMGEKGPIVISSHTGLHVLGVQTESNSAKWAGNNDYNVDMSYEMAGLINSYASEYGMDIIFFFGHDHSKQEEEFDLGPGDVLHAEKNYAEKTYEPVEISFYYRHAGYLTSGIGGNRHYSFVTWDDDSVKIDFCQIENGKETDIYSRIKDTENENVAADTGERDVFLICLLLLISMCNIAWLKKKAR